MTIDLGYWVLCLAWEKGRVCTRAAGHSGKHRFRFRVIWWKP